MYVTKYFIVIECFIQRDAKCFRPIHRNAFSTLSKSLTVRTNRNPARNPAPQKIIAVGVNIKTFYFVRIKNFRTTLIFIETEGQIYFLKR